MSNDLLFNPGSLTVMIVDDHDPIRKGIKRVIAAMGFAEVVECFDGEDALKVLSKRPVDLMILDLYMRNVSGFDVLEHIRNRAIASDIPVIVVTGEASKEEIVKVADMGAEDYVLKPFQAQDLEKKVVKTLNKYFSPTPVLLALRTAERKYLSEEYPEALKEFTKALVLDPQSARAVHGKALTLDKLNRADEAITTLLGAVKTNRTFHKNFGAIADLYLKQNKIAEAIEAMQHELEINPKQPNRQIHVAKLLLKEGQAAAAIEHYRVALMENPKHLEALMGMGHAYGMSDNLEKALYYFKRVRRYHGGATKALEAAMRYCLSSNEGKKFELLLKDEKGAHPDRTDAVVLLAIFYVKQDRDDDALSVVDELLGREADHIHALRIRASVLLKRRNFSEALPSLERIAKLAPTADAFSNVAEALLALNRTPDSLQALSRAIALDPNHAHTMLLLAQAHMKTAQWLKATILFRRAAQLGANRDTCQSEAQECSAQAVLRRQRPRVAS